MAGAWGALRSLWEGFRLIPIAGLWAFGLGYVAADYHFYSFDKYFRLGEVIIPTVVSQSGFLLDATGGPIQEFKGGYKVVLREAGTARTIVEYPKSGVIPYRPSGEGVTSYGTKGFDWWVGQEGSLEPLPTGVFQVETCWTVYDRPASLGHVSDCVISNTFRVSEKGE